MEKEKNNLRELGIVKGRAVRKGWHSLCRWPDRSDWKEGQAIMAKKKQNIQTALNPTNAGLLIGRTNLYAVESDINRIMVYEKNASGLTDARPDAYIRILDTIRSRTYDKVMYLGKNPVDIPLDIPGNTKEDKFKWILLHLLDSAGDQYTILAEKLREEDRTVGVPVSMWEGLLIEIWAKNILRAVDYYLDPVKAEELEKADFSPEDPDFCIQVLDVGRTMVQEGVSHSLHIQKVLSFFMCHMYFLRRFQLSELHNRFSKLPNNKHIVPIPAQVTMKMMDDYRQCIINLEVAVSELTIESHAPIDLNMVQGLPDSNMRIKKLEFGFSQIGDILLYNDSGIKNLGTQEKAALRLFLQTPGKSIEEEVFPGGKRIGRSRGSFHNIRFELRKWLKDTKVPAKIEKGDMPDKRSWRIVPL
jgi:hypothetical protein